MKLIERSQYLEQLKDVVGTPDIKVITGIRRCGKSKLMQAFVKYLQETYIDANIIHIDFNLTEYEELMEYHALHDFALSKYIPDKQNFLLVDEIQNCTSFERAINSLHASEKYDIYLTGSNAFLLSSDLATLFTGRTFEIKIYPFSFKEYCLYYESSDLEAAFEAYTQEGGMAGAYLYKTDKDKYAYIADVFRTLILRDIRQKYKIRNTAVLNKLVDFMMDNISNITSVRNIMHSLNATGDTITDKTIGSYIHYLTQAFLFYPIRRYDLRGKKYLASSEKYYLADHSFRYAVLGNKNMDYGRMYENMVAIELLRRGYDVYVGKLYKKEVDFVASRQNEKIYIQVCDDISQQTTLKRETESLLKIADAYPKMIIAHTRHDVYQYEGIQIINLPDWLMG